MLPVIWQACWLTILDDTLTVPYAHRAPALAPNASDATPMSGDFVVRDDFTSTTLLPWWMMIRTPRESWFDLTSSPGALTIRGRPIGLGDRAQPSFIGR